MWSERFVPHPIVDSPNLDDSYNIYLVDGMHAVVSHFVINYFNLRSSSVDKFMYNTDSGEAEPLNIKCTFTDGSSTEYSLSPDEMWPFENATTDFYQTLSSTSMSFTVTESQLTYRRLCIEHTLEQRLEDRFSIKIMSISNSAKICPHAPFESSPSVEVVLGMFTGVLAAFSLGSIAGAVLFDESARTRWLRPWRLFFLTCTDLLLLIQSLQLVLGRLGMFETNACSLSVSLCLTLSRICDS